jgi:hypothetical protein
LQFRFEHIENDRRSYIRIKIDMFFTFPEDVRWNDERQAVEFGVEIGEYQGVVRVPRRVFQRLLPERPTPERCVEAYHLQRTRFERIVERKLRQRQLTEDGNVEISGRDLRDGDSAPHRLLSR